MQSGQQKEARRRNRRLIRGINEAVSIPQHPEADYVTPDVLARLPIQISPLSFYPDAAIDFGRRFSRPMTEEYFESNFGGLVRPYDSSVNLAWEPYESARRRAGGKGAVSEQYFHDIWRALSRHMRKKDCPPDAKLDSSNSGSMEGLYGWRPTGATQLMSQLVNERYLTWSTFSVEDLIGNWTPPDGRDYADHLPHMACWLHHSAPLDDRILRSELVCITSMMKGRMKHSLWKAHCVFPVFCYTLNGPYVRVTQAHFDGRYLHLRRTEPIEFIPAGGDCSAIKMLLRWIAAEPIGNTKWVSQRDGFDDLKMPQSPSPSLPQEISTTA